MVYRRRVSGHGICHTGDRTACKAIVRMAGLQGGQSMKINGSVIEFGDYTIVIPHIKSIRRNARYACLDIFTEYRGTSFPCGDEDTLQENYAKLIRAINSWHEDRRIVYPVPVVVE